jgi:hypothetical protein
VYTAWEYLALWKRYRFSPAEVDTMPPWVVRHCLTVGP